MPGLSEIGADDGTCRPVDTETWECVIKSPWRYDQVGKIHVMECDMCGRTYEHVNGNYDFCPWCKRRICNDN